MSKVHSHYEKLKVPRDASQQTIRDSYRSLSQKNHPDRNPGKDDAADIMAMLNVAYAALSDPLKRREHDEWIARSERVVPREMAWKSVYPVGAPRQGPAFEAVQPVRSRETASRAGPVKKHLRRYAVAYAAATVSIALVAMIGLQSTHSMQSGLAEKFSKLDPRATGYARPPTAPNGRPWPSKTGYIDGLPILSADGTSELVVDNTQNDVDMFAKLIALEGSRTVVARSFLVSAHTSFVVHKLSTGSYDLRYRNLGTGDLQRSQLFEVEEVKTENGVQHSTVKLPLYKAQNGNMQTFSLSESEF